MVSRVLGYARDFFIARVFGASLVTDAFFVAFKIPNLLRRMFAEGAFSQAFVPILAEHKNRDPEGVKALVDSVATLLFLALVLSAALGIAAAPLIVYVTAPGFAADPGQVRAHRAAAAHHLSLHRLHFAGRARRRHSQYLEPLCGPGHHAGAAQRLVHRRRRVLCRSLRPARAGARRGRCSRAGCCSSPFSCLFSPGSGCCRAGGST
jgi:hypothetical protein